MRHVDFIRFFHKSHMALMSSEHLQLTAAPRGFLLAQMETIEKLRQNTEDIRNAFELSISTISKDARFT